MQLNSYLFSSIILIPLVFDGFATAAEPAELPVNDAINKGKISIKITNVQAMKGAAMIAVFNNEANWLSKAVFATALELNTKNCTDEACIWSVDSAPVGDYGIAIYHDENENRKMDTNFIGIPKEDYGFSNNVSAAFGPPSWHKAKFSVQQGLTEQEISLK